MLIGISGKKRAGKDAVGKTIQWLTSDYYKNNVSPKNPLENNMVDIKSPYQIKKFADKLKDIVCMLIGCTRDELEDREFKETPLGEEWWNISKPEVKMFIPYTDKNWETGAGEYLKYFKKNLVKTTPRLMLQKIGTEGMREIIHNDTWVNALFADYKKVMRTNANRQPELFNYPNWIITDVRFPNEAQAIKDRGGIVIRVNRNSDIIDNHLSETALDNFKGFDHVIDNNGDISSLIEKIKQLNLV